MRPTISSAVPFRVRGVGVTVRGWWFAGAGAVSIALAYLTDQEALLFVGCLLLALPAVGLAVVAASRPRVTVTRAFDPAVLPAGSVSSVALTVHNRRRRATLPALWSDGLPWYPYETDRGRMPRLQPRGGFAARSAAVVGYDVVPPRRGVFEIGPVVFETVDAFALASALTTAGESRPLVVTPDVVALAPAGLTVPAGDGESTVVQRRSVGDEDDIMTREYRRGDAMRRVHWRASARHGDLMVRQEEPRSRPTARILVDTARSGYPDADADPTDVDADSESFEWVVRMLASAGVHLRRAGFEVSILESAAPQLDDLGRGRRRTWGDEEFLARLATVGLVDEAASRPPRRPGATGPLVALVGEPTGETVEWLASQRRAGELAVVFAVRAATPLDGIAPGFVPVGTESGSIDRLVDAGWLVVPVRAEDDPAAAWQAVVHETGRARGSA